MTRTFYLTILLAAVAPAQNIGVDDSPIADVPGYSYAFLIPLSIHQPGTGDTLHIVSTQAKAKLSLLLPDGKEVSASNPQGFTFTVPADGAAQLVDVPSRSWFKGFHTVIDMPPAASTGKYLVKVNTVGIGASTEVAVFYKSPSPLHLRGLATGKSHTVGRLVLLSAALPREADAVTVTAKVRMPRDVSANVKIGSLQLVSKSVHDGITEYTYSVRATNRGTALSDVQATPYFAAGSFPAGRVVRFGEIAARSTKDGLNSFTIAVPPGFTFNVSAVDWRVAAMSLPISVDLTDSEPRDGIFTGTYKPSEAGVHLVELTATGTLKAVPFVRTAGFGFKVTPGGSFESFTGRGVKARGSAKYSGIEVTANVYLPARGRYRLTLELANTTPEINIRDAKPIEATADVTVNSAGPAKIAVVFPATPKILEADSLDLQNAKLYALRPRPELIAHEDYPGIVTLMNGPAVERDFAIAASGHSATLVDTNGIPGAEILRFTVALTGSRVGPCHGSALLTTSTQKDIQSVNFTAGARGEVLSQVKIDFDGTKVAEAGLPGPFNLSWVWVSCSSDNADKNSVFQTLPYALDQFPVANLSPLEFDVTVEPTALTIAPTTPRGDVYVNVTIQPAKGFKGLITPSISGLPPGVQVRFGPLPPWYPDRNSIGLTTSNAASGTYPITLTMTAGAVVRSATLQLTISDIIPISLETQPPGHTIVVDGETRTSPLKFAWTAGEPHTLSVPRQVDGNGVAWILDQWNDQVYLDRKLIPVTSKNMTAKLVQDFSGAVQVTFGPPVYNPQLSLWSKAVTLRNTGATAILGDVYLGVARAYPYPELKLRNAEKTIANLRAVKIGSQGIPPGATITGSVIYALHDPLVPEVTLDRKVLVEPH